MNKEITIEDVEEFLRSAFTGGHKDFIDLTLDELKLYSSKNTDYTKGGNPNGGFIRVSNILKNYPNLDLGKPETIALLYAIKQLDSTLWMLNQHYEGNVENIDTRLRDIHVYMKIARILHKEQACKEKGNVRKIQEIPKLVLDAEEQPH